LQRIGEMTLIKPSPITEEVEKEARSDMARIIRQVEAEAREDGTAGDEN